MFFVIIFNFMPIFFSSELIWIDWSTRNVVNFWFSKSFFYVKNQPNLSIFFSLKNTKSGEELLSMTLFDYFHFWSTLFSEIVPNFWRAPINPNQFRWKNNWCIIHQWAYLLGCANKDLDGSLGPLCKFIEYCRIVALLPVIP